MIILPKKKYIEVEPSVSSAGMEGWFTLEAVRRSGLVTRQVSFKARSVGPFHNMLTDIGLDRISTQNAVNHRGYLSVGVGTPPPQFSDQELENRLATVSRDGNGNHISPSAPDYYFTHRIAYEFDIGELGNNNLTEIGVGGGSTGDLLMSRELIRDSGGSPVAFPIQSDEQLRATYEIRCYVDTSDVHATVMVGATQHDTITRPSGITTTSFQFGAFSGFGVQATFAVDGNSNSAAYSGDLVSMTDTAPSGSLGGTGGGGLTQFGYVPGSYQRDFRATFPTTAANGDIRTVVHNSIKGMRVQVQYDPPITKNNDEIVRLDHRVSWARR